MAEIIGIKQDHHLDASGGLELPDKVSGQFRGLPKRASHGLGMRGLGIQADAPRDDLVTANQNGTNILGPLNIGSNRNGIQFSYNPFSSK
jgi:hypothetical protein